MKINILNKDKLPFKHLSPSSMIEFLVNEKSFFKKYVLYEGKDTTSPSMIIGTAFHFAMEQYYNSKILYKENPDKSKILIREEVIDQGINSCRKLFGYHEKRGLEDMIKRKQKDIKKEITFDHFYEHYLNLIEFDWSGIDDMEKQYNEEPEGDRKKELHDTLIRVKDKFNRATMYMNDIGLEMDPDLGFYNDEIEEAKRRYIDYGKTGSRAKAEEQLIIGINNYLDYEPKLDPIMTEMGETCEFQDFDGNDMIIPIKGKPDLICNDHDEDIIIDYKLVSEFSQRNGAYELQAGSYYFTVQALRKKKPKELWFVETIKKELSPTKGMKKPEIQALCLEHSIEFTPKDTIATMVEKLLAKEVLKIPEAINIIKIKFEEEPEVIQTFIEIYREILNRSYYFFIEKTLKFLPNPKADYTGVESWEDFKLETINEIDVIQELEESRTKDTTVFTF